MSEGNPAGAPAPAPQLGRSLLAGVACVAVYSLATALFGVLRVSWDAPPPRSAQTSDIMRLALAGGFLIALLEGPILWIIGSGLFACGLSLVKRPRSFRLVLAVTGLAFLPLAAFAATALGLWVCLGVFPLLLLTRRFLACVFLLGGVVVIIRSKRMMEVEPLRSGAALAFAAVLFILGKWLPSHLWSK